VGTPKKEYYDDDTLVVNAINYIELYGLDEEGILRINGRMNDVKTVRLMLLEGKKLELNQIDVHTVASVMKAYFNESPHSILPEEKYSTLIKFIQEERADCVQNLRNIIIDLPPNHQKVLHKLILFLDNVQRHSCNNKMESVALSVIFGPLLIRSAAALSPSQALADNPACVKIANIILDNFQIIFEGIGLNTIEPEMPVGYTRKNDGMLKKMDRRSSGSGSGSGSAGPSSPSATKRNSKKLTPYSTNSLGGNNPLGSIEPRMFFVKAVEDLTAAYEKAKQNKIAVIKDIRDTAVREYKSAKEKAIKQNEVYEEFVTKWKEASLRVENETSLRQSAVTHLENLKKYYEVDEEGDYLAKLQRDELANIDEAQTLVELKEAEIALAMFDQREAEKAKSVLETPHELLQSALWKTLQELKRLEITEQEASNWTF